MILSVRDGSLVAASGALALSPTNKQKVDELAAQLYGLVVDSKRLLVATQSAVSAGAVPKPPQEKLRRLVVNLGRKEAMLTSDHQYVYVVLRPLE
ncbi:hypothetical protein HDU98_005971 [Podochytrium sp. JEL0797]|nr:hypothetical protein HDU98_005971 [Podochytrium sp. JEL0797]